MKICLIRFKLREGAKQTIPWHFSFYKNILEPLGFEVDIIDDQIENMGTDRLTETVLKNKYDIIGTGGIGSAYNQLRNFSDKIKKNAPSILIAAGGQIVADYEFILKRCPIDAAILGEGEITLRKVAEAFRDGSPLDSVPGIAFRKDGRIICTEPEKLVKLDDLPDYNFDNIDISRYDTSVGNAYLIDGQAVKLKEEGHRFLGIFLARGCPYNCFFCYRHLKGYRTYSRERLEKILSGLKEKGFSFMSYGDECVTSNRNNLRNICEISKKLGIYWMTSGRADHINDEMLKMLKTHNCVGLQIGVESFDDAMLNAMNKKVSASKNIEAMNLLYKNGLHSVLQLVTGSPGENRKSIFNTRKGVWSCHFRDDRIASAILNPYPGSPAYWFSIEKGIIKDKEWVHSNFSSKGEIVINFSDLSMRELKTWQMWLPLEAGLSYRLKNRAFLLNKSLIVRMKNFFSCYMRMLLEPVNFTAFSYYLLLGFTYWLKPVPSPEFRELGQSSGK